MDAERWKLLSPLLDRALALSEGERARWLATLEVDDRSIATELEMLLSEADGLAASNYLEHAPGLAVWHAATLAGQVFGAYTLEQPLGHGGMGSVWLAHRSDGRYEGKAAVKLLNLALVGRTAEERFRREGDVLARLAHRHITRLIDAGIAPTGQPYLVLEYVEGERIDAWCDHHRLDIDARLALFLDVLAAVAHAHSHLIVHRDIKPANVLVDRSGSVKLVDFGIAKLVDDDQHGGEATQLTRDGGRVLTPEFSAPEQLLGQPVTTATDVYALGVLLYLLLVGRHPAGEAAQPAAGLVRSIVDTSPAALSDAVSREGSSSAEAVAEAAGHRGSTPERLHRRLRGDLDNIVAKALKKDPRERYASVDAFADDLRRHLGHEPVAARPDSLAYRAGRFVRRNRLPVALASVALAAVLAGLAGTIMQARRAIAQRDFALKQVARVHATNDLTSFLLYDAGSEGKPFTADELLARGAGIVERAAAGPSKVDLLVTIGNGYWRLGQHDRALPIFREAYALSRSDSDPDRRARAACAFGKSLAARGDREAVATIFAATLADLADEPQHVFDRIECEQSASVALRSVGDVKAGVAHAEAAQRLLASLADPPNALDFSVADNLAEAYRAAGDLPRADRTFARADQLLSALGRENTQSAGTLFNNWGIARLQMGDPRRAEELLRRAIEVSESDRAQHGVAPMLLANYANVLDTLARYREAAIYVGRALEGARESGNEYPIRVALGQQAKIALHLGDLARARTALDEIEPRLPRALAPDHYTFAAIASLLALLAAASHDDVAAIAPANRAVDLAHGHPESAFVLPDLLVRRSVLETDMGRAVDARNDAEAALALEQSTIVTGSSSTLRGATYLALGRALALEGDTNAAARMLEAAAAELRATVGVDHPDTRLAETLRKSLAAAPAR
jgi:serine/threonine-protein kinase